MRECYVDMHRYDWRIYAYFFCFLQSSVFHHENFGGNDGEILVYNSYLVF